MPETISEARTRLPAHVRRHPDAVLLPYETFTLLLDVAEDIAIAERIREREATDDGQRTRLAEVAAEFGIDLATLDRQQAASSRIPAPTRAA